MRISLTLFTDNETKRWTGQADIPVDYFPPNVSHFNAYAIHNQQIEDQDPIYKSLYPSDGAEPDFHDLKSFQEFSELPLLKNVTDYSDIWRDALDGNGSTSVKMLNVFFYFLSITAIIFLK